MEHVQPIDRAVRWRPALLAVGLVAAIGLAVVGGLSLVHRLDGTRPVPGTGPVRQGQAATHAKLVPLRPRSRISVAVLNGNGLNGAAGAAATRLLAHGYRHALPSDAPNQNYARSLVLFRPGWEREAHRLARDAGVRTVVPLDGHLPAADSRAQLVLILGH